MTLINLLDALAYSAPFKEHSGNSCTLLLKTSSWTMSNQTRVLPSACMQPLAKKASANFLRMLNGTHPFLISSWIEYKETHTFFFLPPLWNSLLNRWLYFYSCILQSPFLPWNESGVFFKQKLCLKIDTLPKKYLLRRQDWPHFKF